MVRGMAEKSNDRRKRGRRRGDAENEEDARHRGRTEGKGASEGGAEAATEAGVGNASTMSVGTSGGGAMRTPSMPMGGMYMGGSGKDGDDVTMAGADVPPGGGSGNVAASDLYEPVATAAGAAVGGSASATDTGPAGESSIGDAEPVDLSGIGSDAGSGGGGGGGGAGAPADASTMDKDAPEVGDAVPLGEGDLPGSASATDGEIAEGAPVPGEDAATAEGPDAEVPADGGAAEAGQAADIDKDTGATANGAVSNDAPTADSAESAVEDRKSVV